MFNFNIFFPGMREYCQFESFNVTCPENSVILLKTASYGRMRVGHCVQKQYEGPNQPCKADVLHYLDPRCSGRRSCDVPIPELEKIASPCPTDLKSYLEASYECVQGMSCAAFASWIRTSKPSNSCLSKLHSENL